MYIAWCCNRMVRERIAYQYNNYEPLWQGDTFNKKIARDIAFGRVMKRRHCITLVADENKIDQMVKWLLNNTSNHVRDIICNAIFERTLTRAPRSTTLTGAVIKVRD